MMDIQKKENLENFPDHNENYEVNDEDHSNNEENFPKLSINSSKNGVESLMVNPNSKEFREKRRKVTKEKSERLKLDMQLSLRHLIFTVILWIGFIGSLIVGFLLHFKIQSGITASSILWSLSFIFFIVGTAYTVLYCKLKCGAITNKERIYWLKFFPL